MPRGQERCHYLSHSMTASLVLWWMTSMSASVDALGKIRRVGRRLGVGVGATRVRMIRKLAEALERLTADTPLVLVLADLHWSDLAEADVSKRLGSARA
jgi:hypothetical protein